MATPQGLSQATFADWVFTSPEDLHTYRDFYTVLWDEPDERVASAAVAPANVEEVQSVVRAKHGGRLPGELELRTDLDANALRYLVRNGSGAMPMFRQAELSDAEIEAIAGYIRVTAQAIQGARR